MFNHREVAKETSTPNPHGLQFRASHNDKEWLEICPFSVTPSGATTLLCESSKPDLALEGNACAVPPCSPVAIGMMGIPGTTSHDFESSARGHVACLRIEIRDATVRLAIRQDASVRHACHYSDYKIRVGVDTNRPACEIELRCRTQTPDNSRELKSVVRAAAPIPELQIGNVGSAYAQASRMQRENFCACGQRL